MKMRLVVFASAVVLVVAAVFVAMRPQAGNVALELRSDPFPLSVGTSMLLVSVNQSVGAAVSGATVSVTAEMDHAGMLPVSGVSSTLVDGAYHVPIIWSMPGHWTVNVTARLPDQQTLQEQFEVYVYSIPPANAIPSAPFRSVREVEATVTANEERELWIVIPQGTREMIKLGQGDDVIPAEIRLQLSGQNVLVIRNDDIADHTIGPFFIRAGETIRQEFTNTAVFQGTCTVRHNAEVSIIVEA